MRKRSLGIGVLLLWVVMSAIGFYNGTIVLQENLKSLEAQVNNMFDRRADLIPQLSAVVKRYAEYEKSTMTEVISLREPLNQAVSQLGALETMIQQGGKSQARSAEFGSILASALSSVKLSVEAYPNLKANEQFTSLFASLEGSENRIRVEIKTFNDKVPEYNVKIRAFPWGVFLSPIFGFRQIERINPDEGKDIKTPPMIDKLLDSSSSSTTQPKPAPAPVPTTGQ